MDNYKNDSMEILFESGDLNKLIWKGKSVDRDPASTLKPYLDEMSEKIKGGAIEINFTELEYMNSSTVPPIIQLAKKLNTDGTETKILYNSSSPWQSASFKALETIILRMDNVSIKGI